MKKYFFICATLLSVVLVFSSCSQQDEIIEEEQSNVTTEKQAMRELKKELDNYNASFFRYIPETRSSMPWWKRLYRAVYVDAVGGIIGTLFGPWGTVAGAVSFSGIVICADIESQSSPFPPFPSRTRSLIEEEYEETPIYELMYTDALQSVVLTPNLTNCLDSTGYYHNRILKNLADSNLVSIAPLQIEVMIGEACNQAEQMSNNGKGNSTVFDLKVALNFNQLKALCQNAAYSSSSDAFVDALIDLYPEREDELIFLEDYIDVLCDIDHSNNDGTYASGVLNLISNSTVSDEMKVRLANAVIIGNASARLWNFQ